MQEALRPPSGSPIIGGQRGLLGFLYSVLVGITRAVCKSSAVSWIAAIILLLYCLVIGTSSRCHGINSKAKQNSVAATQEEIQRGWSSVASTLV